MDTIENSSIIGMPLRIFKYLHLDHEGPESVLLQLELKICN